MGYNPCPTPKDPQEYSGTLIVYWKERSAFELLNPLPVELLRTFCPIGDSEEEYSILAVPGTVTQSQGGVLREVSLTISADAISEFRCFCSRFGIPGNPQWVMFGD